jgi:hypothetical protein
VRSSLNISGERMGCMGVDGRARAAVVAMSAPSHAMRRDLCPGMSTTQRVHTVGVGCVDRMAVVAVFARRPLSRIRQAVLVMGLNAMSLQKVLPLRRQRRSHASVRSQQLGM